MAIGNIRTKLEKYFAKEKEIGKKYDLNDFFRNSKASRRNQISYMAECHVPKEEACLTEAEEPYFDYLIELVVAYKEIVGEDLVFEPEEIDFDDPILDKY